MHIDLFKGKKKWYWRLSSKNGQKILSSQGYYSRFNATRAASKLAKLNGLPIRTR